MSSSHAFKKSVAIYPNGLMVDLSEGTSGIVKQQNDRPVERILTEGGQPVLRLYEIDLANNIDIMITDCRAI